MSTTHHMKMAKASQADIDAAIELYQFLQCMQQGRPAADAVDEFGYKGYDDLIDRGDACDDEFVLRAHERGGLVRVVWGMQTLLDPKNEVVEPDLPHLALHPKHEQAARERDELWKAKNELIDERDEARAQCERLCAELAAVKTERDEMEAAAARVLRTWPSMDTAIAIHEIGEQFAKLNAKRAKRQGGAS